MIGFISCKNFTKTLNLYQLSLPQISLSMENGAKPLLVNQIARLTIREYVDSNAVYSW